jgi:hypothetical protein
VRQIENLSRACFEQTPVKATIGSEVGSRVSREKGFGEMGNVRPPPFFRSTHLAQYVLPVSADISVNGKLASSDSDLQVFAGETEAALRGRNHAEPGKRQK